MFSEGQSLYLQEVLGVRPEDLVRVAVMPEQSVADAVAVSVAVMTGPLAPEGRELLMRILGSAKLTDPTIVESLDLGQAPPAAHTLIFNGQTSGREGQTWQFPKLSEMLGASAEVSAKKKLTWALLQQLVKEL